VAVSVENGRERIITKKRLHAIDGMVWLTDGSSVAVSAREAASAPLRLWRITLASGVMQPLTTDVSDHLLAGLTHNGQKVAAVRVDVGRTLWWAPVSDLSRARQVASDAGELSELESLAWMPDGRLLYTSTESGNADIWVYDAAKDKRRRLTTDARDDFNPTSSPDGTIVFASERSGASGLWAMSDAGETSVRQLTTGGDSRPTIAPRRFRSIPARCHPVGSDRTVADAAARRCRRSVDSGRRHTARGIARWTLGCLLLAHTRTLGACGDAAEWRQAAAGVSALADALRTHRALVPRQPIDRVHRLRRRRFQHLDAEP
jgi:WD40 repeat protein